VFVRVRVRVRVLGFFQCARTVPATAGQGGRTNRHEARESVHLGARLEVDVVVVGHCSQVTKGTTSQMSGCACVRACVCAAQTC
jgi:hypothetical protein